MKILLFILTLAVLSGVSTADVRKWTPADPSAKSVLGEFTSVQDGVVAIKKKSGGKFFIPLAALVQEDQNFVAAELKMRADMAALAEVAAKLKGTEMAKAVAGATKLEGRKLKSYNVFSAKAPEYYLLCWGGSWCPACREATPHLVKEYGEVISAAKNVEAVLLSCDQTQDRMLEFMNDMKLNFPALSLEKWQKSKPLKAMEPALVPHYKLVDTNGTLIAEGEEAKAKALEFARQSAQSATAAAENKK